MDSFSNVQIVEIFKHTLARSNKNVEDHKWCDTMCPRSDHTKNAATHVNHKWCKICWKMNEFDILSNKFVVL